ncbi:MAG: FAD-dependent oxidoreductase [Deltaproteobacteria bacterium]|nr:FAD-dependent oxidoreductase [Deltaproteobacteria bacterium]
MASKRHVIVGAGTAGINAIRTLRQMGNQDSVVLVSGERPYSRMVLPYVLEGGISEGHTATVSPNQLERWGVEMRFGRQAASLDAKGRSIKLDNGDELPFDTLLIATGSSAARLPLPGADGQGIHSFWTLKDARGLNTHITPNAHVVMVGAGFISFTILNGIMQRAGKVTVVEVEPRILPRMVDTAGSEMTAAWLTARGVTLRTGARLKEIAQTGNKRRLSFADGTTLDADVVVMATGIRPNLGWLEGSGVKVDKGVVVDEYLQSNLAGIYAAGDVAQARNLITGASEVHAIEPTAMEHGRVAGANMAGERVSYPGSLLMNVVGVAGLEIASFGAWDDAKAESITDLRPGQSSYRLYRFLGGRMVGAILISPEGEAWRGNDLGMLKGLVQSGADLSGWKRHLKANPLDLKPAYLAARTVTHLMPRTLLGRPSSSPGA